MSLWNDPITMKSLSAIILAACCVAGAAEPPPSVTDVTWVMIWNGSTEHGWWKRSDYHGCRVLVDREWQSINWNDRAHIRTYVAAIAKAGIDAIIVDFTNGFRWRWQAAYVQELCAAHGMKMAVAFNPGDGETMEAGCREVWEQYAAPTQPLARAYLHVDGKPLVVLYTVRKGYEASVAQTGDYRRRFSTTWASGEDSERDKWGWQLEPYVGPVSSDQAMFVTGAVKFGSPRTGEEEWRRHLAWLDYGFLMASQAGARYRIVGSFDDVHERNGWMVVDTRDAPPGWQMRDVHGALSAEGWYRRVSEWLIVGRPQVIAGGALPDGAYRLVADDGRVLVVPGERLPLARASIGPSGDTIDRLVWLYHVGDNEYRLIKLSAGLAIEAADGTARINWDTESNRQRWMVRPRGGGWTLTNKETGERLVRDGDTIAVTSKAPPIAEEWRLVEVATLPR
jgi:hypothetical protein